MLVSCTTLINTLHALHFAYAIGVTGACPAYVQINNIIPGTILDFSEATAVRLDLVGVTQVQVQNFISTGSQYSAMNVINSSQILILQPRITNPGTAGITIQGSDTVEVAGAWISGSGGDGVDIAGSTNVNIHDGACEANVVTANHPDCVQEWSITNYPLQHIIVQNMMAVGATQGFDLWDHSDYGATDIKFLNNTAALTNANCIGAFNVHQLVVSGNTCLTLPGANGPVGLDIESSPGAVITNNSVGAPVAKSLQ